MNTLKKIYLVSFVMGSMLMSVLFTQGQKVNLNEFSSAITPTSFSAGEDASICNDNEFTTQGVSPSNIITMWQTSGDGIFDNTQSLLAVYTPGEHDIIDGQVTLYLILFPMGGGGNEMIYDEMILYLDNCTITNKL